MQGAEQEEEQASSLCYICMNEEHTEALVDSPCSCHHRKVHMPCLINMVQCRHSFQCPVCTSRLTGLDLDVTYRINVFQTLKNAFLLVCSCFLIVLGYLGWLHRRRLGNFNRFEIDVVIGLFIGLGTVVSTFWLFVFCILDSTTMGSFFVYHKVVRVRRSITSTENTFSV